MIKKKVQSEVVKNAVYLSEILTKKRHEMRPAAYNKVKPRLAVVKNPDTAEMFEVYYTKSSPKDCWLWVGTKNHHGYGVIHWNGRPQVAHRVSYELYNGPIIEETIDHMCANKGCVNPHHLQQMELVMNARKGNRIGPYRTHYLPIPV